jgi:hypothetical protein
MDNIFLFIVGIFMIVFYANRGGDRESIEGFNDISKMTVTDLQNLIYSTYKADVQAIKNLADTAAKLQAGGLTVPGNLNVSGNISGPTVNTINDKITNAINTLNTNISNNYKDLLNRINSVNDRLTNVDNDKQNKINNLNSSKISWDDPISISTFGENTNNHGGNRDVRGGKNFLSVCGGGGCAGYGVGMNGPHQYQLWRAHFQIHRFLQ